MVAQETCEPPVSMVRRSCRSGGLMNTHMPRGYEEQPDDILMARVVEGSAAAFQILAQRHVRQAIAIAQRITHNASDAEELVQEALLRLWTNAHRWDSTRAPFKTWFYRILTNLCIDRLRRATISPLVAAEQAIDPQPGPLARAEGRQIARAIADAIAALPVRQRTALTLCYYHDMSCAEAAKVLSISVSAMEALLVRGRRTLREHLRSLELDGSESRR
jgi:RNA polymerase sigma-70 factor (ECF subfamily)